MSESTAHEFIQEKFSRKWPPERPFLDGTWLGAAFDRNLYPAFAPEEFWTALRNACEGQDVDKVEVVKVDRDAQSYVLCSPVVTPLADVVKYLQTDWRFLKDHYVIDMRRRWACLLDQDVTLFGGEPPFAKSFFEVFGGVDQVVSVMFENFDQRIGDNEPMSSYLLALVGASSPIQRTKGDEGSS